MAVATTGPLTRDRAVPRRTDRVRAWLFLLVGLVTLMVVVGGATRLTGSGLSITEWHPVTGIVPPLSEEAWRGEFAKYRASSQYENLNDGMSLPEFKAIYWWEWGHRALGRLTALVLLLPLLFFWWTREVGARLTAALAGIFVLGAAQGGIGWVMVASGLQPGMVAVAPVKLTAHLVMASILLALLTYVAAGVGRVRRGVGSATVGTAAIFALLVLVQIGFGGLVAGSKAGLTYNTWPLMDGNLVPPLDTLFTVQPWIANFAESPALVQLTHRTMAYLVVAVALAQALLVTLRRSGTHRARRARGIAALAVAQAALGIVTLLLVVPLWAGLAHQLLAMMLLIAAVTHWRMSATRSA